MSNESCATDQLGSADQLDRAARQLQDCARSEDFAAPPPFLALYCGRLERTRFFRLNSLSDGTLLGEDEYEEFGSEIWDWDWDRVKAFQAQLQAIEPKCSRIDLFDMIWWMYFRHVEPVAAPLSS